MKKFYGILFLLALMAFKTNVQAQTPCDAVTVTVIAPSPQTGANNYFGARVSIAQPYSENVTVNGILFEDGNHPNNIPFTLTIIAGELLAETADTYFQLGPASSAGIEINSVSPCPPSEGGHFLFYNINNIELLTNTTLKNKVIQTFLSGPDNINPDVQYNTDSLKLLTFDYTDIKGVYTEEVNFAPNTSNNHVFFAFSQGTLVADMVAEATVNTDSYGNTIIAILDHTGQIYVNLTISSGGSLTLLKNPNWSDPYSFSLNASNNLMALHGPNISMNHNMRTFWDRFISCVGTGLCQLGGGCGGGGLGTLVGAALIQRLDLLGASVLLGCTLHATFF